MRKNRSHPPLPPPVPPASRRRRRVRPPRPRRAPAPTPDAFASRVWADTAYRSQANEHAIEASGLTLMIHFRKPRGRPMPGPQRRANRARGAVRARVEHPFAEQKSRMGLFVRTIGQARAAMKIGMANLAYNFRRLVWHRRQAAFG